MSDLHSIHVVVSIDVASMLGQCLVPWRVSQGCLGSRSGHQLYSILLASNNQGSVYKKCVFYKYTIKVGARFVFLSAVGPLCQGNTTEVVLVSRNARGTRLRALEGRRVSSKSPSRVPRAREEVGRRNKRATNPLWPVVRLLYKKQTKEKWVCVQTCWWGIPYSSWTWLLSNHVLTSWRLVGQGWERGAPNSNRHCKI